jgi:hypothetical protein
MREDSELRKSFEWEQRNSVTGRKKGGVNPISKKKLSSYELDLIFGNIDGDLPDDILRDENER